MFVEVKLLNLWNFYFYMKYIYIYYCDYYLVNERL